MKDPIKERIKSNLQIKKFGAYGFFKNLRFFEPYIIIFLLSNGLNLFQIGALYSIKEIIINVFEVPSGLFSDKFGNKKTLLICFIFYILSFLSFALSSHFIFYALAMILFGFGDAFRSGAHKSIIYNYLEQKNWFHYKTFVYGRTRSFSLLGSSISATLSILLILWVKEIQYLFIISIIPYIIDFILILSYPNNIDQVNNKSIGFKDFLKSSYQSLKTIFYQKEVLRIVNSSSVFESLFKSIKDYIQPILKITLSGITLFSIFEFSGDETLKIALGISYSIIYIFGSVASRNAYRLLKLKDVVYWMNILFLLLIASFILIAVFIHLNINILIILLFILLYVSQNLRRPFFVDLIGEKMEKKQRTTILSIENQLSSLYTIFLAPVMGFLADTFGVWKMLVIISIFGLSLFGWIKIKK